MSRGIKPPQLASHYPTTSLTPPHNQPHPPAPLQGERGVICFSYHSQLTS